MPTVNPSPFGPKPQIMLASGVPANGGKLFFYAAGSTTKQTTYTDSTGSVGNSNPLILNTLGEPSTEVWFTAGQAYKVVYAPSTDTDPPSAPIWTVDNLRGINDATLTLDQWVVGPAPTFVSATSFTLVGDQTSTFHVGRRVKTVNTSGTIYSTITASVFAAVTTITVANDSGSLDSGLSAVWYGLLSKTNDSMPRGIFVQTLTWDLLTAAAASASATIEFTSKINSTYDEYVILVNDLVPATNATNLLLQVSENAGVAWKSGASDYEIGRAGWGSVTTITTGQQVNATGLTLAASLSNTQVLSAEIRIKSPANTGKFKNISSHCTYYTSAPEAFGAVMAGVYKGSTNAINGIRFSMSSGNIASGNFVLYGIRKS